MKLLLIDRFITTNLIKLSTHFYQMSSSLSYHVTSLNNIQMSVPVMIYSEKYSKNMQLKKTINYMKFSNICLKKKKKEEDYLTESVNIHYDK